MPHDFWLDINSVPSHRRRELRTELKSNLRDAAVDIGLNKALTNIGGTRRLAADLVNGFDDDRGGFFVEVLARMLCSRRCRTAFPIEPYGLERASGNRTLGIPAVMLAVVVGGLTIEATDRTLAVQTCEG